MSPNNLIRHAFALTLFAAAVPASATRLEVQAGRSYMNSDATNVVFVEGVFNPRPIGDSRWSWAPDVSLGWVNGRDLKRFQNSRPTTRDDVWLLGAGARIHYGNSDDWYRHLFLSFQPALTSGRTQALSSGYEFITSVGWQGRYLSFQLRHISNGSLQEPNRGETMALVGIGFDL